MAAVTRGAPGASPVTSSDVSAAISSSNAGQHAGASPAYDYVRDEVLANASSLNVFDNAAASTLRAGSTYLGAIGTSSGTNSVVIGNGAALGARTGCTAVGFSAAANAADSATAVGISSTASGTSAVAVGNSATASGAGNVAIGLSATASSTPCVAIGSSAAVSAANTTAVGANTSCTVSGGVALGQAAASTDTDAVAIGRAVTASAANTVALGSAAAASAVRAVAIGRNAVCAGASSVSIGANCSAAGDNAVAIGGDGATNITSAAGASAIAIGTFASAGHARAIVISGDTAAQTASAAADDVIIARGYIVGNNSGTKHLSPATTGGVRLGVSETAQRWSAVFADRVFWATVGESVAITAATGMATFLNGAGPVLAFTTAASAAAGGYGTTSAGGSITFTTATRYAFRNTSANTQRWQVFATTNIAVNNSAGALTSGHYTAVAINWDKASSIVAANAAPISASDNVQPLFTYYDFTDGSNQVVYVVSAFEIAIAANDYLMPFMSLAQAGTGTTGICSGTRISVHQA